MEIGAQLYTVRDFCKTKDEFAETLKKIADIGYRNVQVSGTCEFEPEWLSERLKSNGLKCVITHTPKDKILSDPKKVADDHTVFGCEYVGLGSFEFSSGDAKAKVEEFIGTYTSAAKSLKENGKYFMYHNHDMEFRKAGNQIVLAALAEGMAPDIMGFTLDTFWVQAGGGDPGYWLERLSGRVPCIHLKDYSYGRKMAVVGEGNINFDRVFEKAESAGTKYMLVEQDDCNGENPFECLKRSYQNLLSFGLK